MFVWIRHSVEEEINDNDEDEVSENDKEKAQEKRNHSCFEFVM